MNKEQFLNTGLLEQYALGLTDPKEGAIVEEYLEKFPELQEELYAMQNALEDYAKQYAITPPGMVKGKIMNGLEDDTPQPRPGKGAVYTSGLSWSKWLSYAALIALTLGYLFQSNRYKNVKQQLSSTTVALSSCENQNKSLLSTTKIYAFISDVNTQPLTLVGTNLSPESRAIVYWNENKEQAYFFASALPTPPEGKQYQIWADVEGEMVSVGVLDYQTNDLQAIKFLANAESLNVTLEPWGGSEHPNVEKLYVNVPI